MSNWIFRGKFSSPKTGVILLQGMAKFIIILFNYLFFIFFLVWIPPFCTLSFHIVKTGTILKSNKILTFDQYINVPRGNMRIMKRKFKLWWSTIPPISTKQNNHLSFLRHQYLCIQLGGNKNLNRQDLMYFYVR